MRILRLIGQLAFFAPLAGCSILGGNKYSGDFDGDTPSFSEALFYQISFEIPDGDEYNMLVAMMLDMPDACATMADYIDESASLQEDLTDAMADPEQDEDAMYEAAEELNALQEEMLPEEGWSVGATVMVDSFDEEDVIGEYDGVDANDALEDAGDWGGSAGHSEEYYDYEAMVDAYLDGESYEGPDSTSWASDGGDLEVKSYTDGESLKLSFITEWLVWDPDEGDYGEYTDSQGEGEVSMKADHCGDLEDYYQDLFDDLFDA